jgi:hypothetical protein
MLWTGFGPDLCVRNIRRTLRSAARGFVRTLRRGRRPATGHKNHIASQQSAAEAVDLNRLNAILHCTILQSSKGGFMEIIYGAFLIGTLAITVMFALDSLN